MRQESAQNDMVLRRPRMKEFLQMRLVPIKQKDCWRFCTQFLTPADDIQ
jgi:hypothetical protein